MNYGEMTGVMYVVPKAFLDSLVENQNKILDHIGSTPQPNMIGDYISEPEAQKMLGRKTTWFYMARTTGELAFTKVGNKVFYAKADILKMLDRHKQSTY